eukprot:SAG11_NODE_2823_length_2938_cov_2.731243_3_plen_195_part_00
MPCIICINDALDSLSLGAFLPPPAGPQPARRAGFQSAPAGRLHDRHLDLCGGRRVLLGLQCRAIQRMQARGTAPDSSEMTHRSTFPICRSVASCRRLAATSSRPKPQPKNSSAATSGGRRSLIGSWEGTGEARLSVNFHFLRVSMGSRAAAGVAPGVCNANSAPSACGSGPLIVAPDFVDLDRRGRCVDRMLSC